MTSRAHEAGAPTTMRGRFSGFLEKLEVDVRLLGMLFGLLVIWVGLHLLTNGTFLTARNLWNLAVQTSVVGIMATGMVLVIVLREIDLSVGSVSGFTGMVTAVLMVEVLPPMGGWAWLVALLLGLLAGALVGVFQGFWIAYREVPSFIVTLAGLMIFRGGAWLLTQGRTVAPLDARFQLLGGGLNGSVGATWSWIIGLTGILALCIITFRSRKRQHHMGFTAKPLWADLLLLGLGVAAIVGFVLVMNAYPRPRTTIPRGIPVPVLILIACAAMMTALVKLTRFGRYIYAIGGNPEAAKLGGINTKRITLWVFVIMGVLSALAGAVATARLNAGANSTGTLSELYVIAAAVIGGTSLYGGVGTIVGAVLGALVMQSLQNGMILIGLTSALQQVIIGGVLILAVWLDVLYRKARGNVKD